MPHRHNEDVVVHFEGVILLAGIRRFPEGPGVAAAECLLLHALSLVFSAAPILPSQEVAVLLSSVVYLVVVFPLTPVKWK